MPSYDPSLFNVSPYYDDFNEDKKFLRTLFRPGYAVQSRELTQLQTVLQNQIERLGSHLFKDGGRVIGGDVSTQTLNFVRILPNASTNPQFELASVDMVGNNLIQRNQDGSVKAKAKVVEYLPSYGDSDPYGVAVISYLSGATFTSGATLESDNPEKYFEVTTSPQSTTVKTQGKSRIVSTLEGIYYVDGFFLKTTDGFLTVYEVVDGVRNFETPSGIFGFEVTKEIVTERDDYSIKDPANGSYNYNAPGAHRYKVDLSLKFVEEGYSEDFIPLVTYSNGEITKRLEDSQYRELVKIFAQRTYDESGNYIVKPFDVAFRDGSGSTMYADVFSGKAYVFGYEYETKFKETIEVPKARTVAEYTDVDVSEYFGNYIKGTYNPSGGDRLNNLFSSVNAAIGERTKTYLVYGSTYAIGATYGTPYAIFTAQLLWVEPDVETEYSTQASGMKLRAYLGNIRFDEGLIPDPNGTTGSLNGDLNLYYFDPVTSVSYRLLSDLDLYSDIFSTSTSRLPKFNDTLKQELVYPINGSLPNTMVSTVDKLEYVSNVFRGFVVSDSVPYPSVRLALGSDYNWCFGNGFDVPSGADAFIDETDGYYVVYESGSAFSRGTLIKIVGTSTSVPSGQVKATAKITADGDEVLFTSRLPNGSYYLVGRVKNIAENIPQSSNLPSKIRTKTLATYTETVTNVSSTLDSFKRVITTNASGDVVEIYFQLNYADAYKIDSIVDGNGADISSRFMFDSGMRDTVYLFGRLYVKPDYFSLYQSNSTFTFTVTYKYFEHSGFGPFVKNSYVGISYDNIPVYVSPLSGKSINLANAIDFRYVAKITGFFSPGTSGGTLASSASSTTTGVQVSYSNGSIPVRTSISTDHEAYLPRIDRLVISKAISADGDTRTIKRIAGTPSDSPQVPEDLGDSMTLYLLKVPAYTFNPNDVKAEGISNNRVTMKELGEISRRVDDLEQHAILSDLELSVAQKDINTSSGEDAIKRAIMVDPFNGHSNADVMDIDHRCSIDVERGELKASFRSNAYSFAYNGTDAGITRTSDNILCAAYIKNPTPLLQQQSSSKTVKPNPFSLPNWVGSMKITPHADNWYDTSRRPVVTMNDAGTNDAWLISDMNSSNGHGSQWNDWESIWTGIAVDADSEKEKSGTNFFAKTRSKDSSDAIRQKWYTKDGINRFAMSSDKKRDQYTADFRKNNFYSPVDIDTMLNRSIVPYAKAKQITFSAYNMKPSTTVYAFMDNIDVTQYCSVGGVTGQLVTGQTAGSLESVTLSLPSGLVSVGEKILRIIDDPNNLVQNATTIAEGIYNVIGYKAENSYGIDSLRNPDIRKQTPTSNKIVSTPLYKSKYLNPIKYNQWIEPLVQTFEISEESYSNGTFLESIDLFFASKDEELPVTVEICPTVSGIPHSTVILPFSSVVKQPAGITADSSQAVATNFKFSSPVYLAPGQYGLIVRTNSSKYSLYAATIGDVDVFTEQRISKTFDGGVLFSANNSNEPSGDNTTDLKFAINRCQFLTVSSQSIVLDHIDQATDDIASVVQPNPFIFVPNGVNATTKIQLGTTQYNITPYRNLYLDTPYTIDDSANVDMILSVENIDKENLTFMVDLDRTNMVVAETIINSSENSTSKEQSPLVGVDDDTARYISKQVRIPGGKTAKELVVILDAYIPSGSFVRVYAKGFNSEQSETQRFREPYYRMRIQQESEFYDEGRFVNSINRDDIKEAIYRVTPNNGDPFDTFGVKICMYSTNKAKVPVIKNLRVVAIE